MEEIFEQFKDKDAFDMRNPVMSAGRILWTIFHRRRSSRFRMD